MYEQVFNFNSRPFTSTPYVKHYFPASAMNQAFGQASICVQRASGPVVAIGDIGTGKSLLLAKLESEFQTHILVVTLVCSSVNSRREFLQNILFQIGQPFNMDSEAELRFAVTQAVQPTEANPNGLLLLIDDAEMLTPDVFDELRVLSNIVVDGTPQVRMVLAGRKSLEERLADPTYASFSQRIASRVFLSNLSREETAAYVAEHINRVGGDGQTMFPSETAAKLQELTDGCPRLINQVCDFGLILAGTRGLTTISASLIEEAWNDVQSLPMGSGIMQTGSASSQSTATSEDNDWTLIEFGQLDDESQPNDGTVYDFENSVEVKDSIVGISPEEEKAKTEVQPQQDAPSEPTSVTVDPELGIDIASLQAMQNAAATKQEAAVTPNADSVEVTSPEEAKDDSSAAEPQAQDSSDEAARTAMEQQLAAVFGTSLPSSTPVEVETSNEFSTSPTVTGEAATPEPPADQPLPFAPEAPEELTLPNPTTSTAGTAAASALAAGVAASALYSITRKPSADEENFKPATTALSEQDLGTVEDATGEQANVLQEPTPESNHVLEQPNSFTPAFSINETDNFVPATQPVETAAEATTEPDDETPIGQPQLSDLARPAASENPFGESFAVEASVPNRPTSEIIEQNQNALKISSSDLEHVQPRHDPTPDEIIHPSTSQRAETSDQHAGPVGVNWLPGGTADDAKVENAESIAQPPASEASQTSSPIELPIAEQEEVSPLISKMLGNEPTRGFSIMPTAGSTTPEIETEIESPQPVEQTADDPTFSVSTEAASENLRVSTPSGPASIDASHNHADGAISADISRQADEILARLNKVNKPAKAVQEDQILADIQAQQREVNDSQLLGNPDEPQASLPIPTPELHQDDSEMLVVNQEVNTTETSGEPETYPMTDSPISSGRAARMDYELAISSETFFLKYEF